jgi:DNA-binding transcriptional MerR regulator
VDKAPEAFRTISEVAAELAVPQHVLRFWESRFHEIRPMKRGGGRRFYRPQDLDLLRGIRHLLYGEGYTIRGVQRILREQGQRFVQQVWQPGAPQPTRMPGEVASETGAEELAVEIPSDRAGTREPEELAAASDARSIRSALEVPKLQAVLEELAECRRLLAGALKDQP